MKLNLKDWEIVNSESFIKAVRFIGPGKADRLRDGSRVKRRWNLSGAQKAQNVPPGSVVMLDNDKHLVTSWHRLAWAEADEAKHFGRLYLIAPINGEYVTWRIESLRHPVETTGTGSVNAAQWRYEDGTPYPDWWAVCFDGKLDSPVRNRENTPGKHYRPDKGDLCALWVGGWDKPKGSDARTDLFPVRYGGSVSPPPPPPQGDDWNDALDAVIREAERLKR